MINKRGDFTINDILSNTIGFYLTLFTASLFINNAWILTNITTVLISATSVCYYILELKFGRSQLITSIILIMFLLCFTTYYVEKRNKIEFIQLRYNQRLNHEMCQIIENIPEGIIIYNNEKRDIVMANQESRRLFRAYNVGGCGSQGGPLDQELPFFDLTAS